MGRAPILLAFLAPWMLSAPTGGAAQQPLRFVDATAEAGIEFEHETGATGERYMVETMGSGAALVDVDEDGWLDAYLVQGASTPGFRADRRLRDALFRGARGGRFAAAPEHAGLPVEVYGMGIAAGDYDDDGFVDLYVTAFGPNLLLRNNGDGTFTDVGAASGTDDPLWGASAAWGDLDADGDLDLYVVNYVDFDWDNHKFCGNPRRNLRAYCHPDVYDALPDRLFDNRGDGTFAQVAEEAGVANTVDGKGLGVVMGDYDDDGDLDVYVANDSTRNFLYTNEGGMSFFDDGLLAGVGYSEDGQAEAGMGTDWGDFDGDGHLDVVVTNLDLETNTLYRNLGDAAFSDQTYATGMGEPSLMAVGFGTNWEDVDNDSDLDLFVANGHIIDNIAEFRDNVTYAQRNHLYRNDGGEFREISSSLGPGMALVKVSRASAAGDYDNDGDVDFLVSNNGEGADLLRNDGGDAAGHWLQLRLVGRAATRTAAGARVLLGLPDGRTLVREVKAGSSYCATGDPRLHVGLGDATAATVSVRWPGNDEPEELGRLEAGRLWLVHQGRGVVASRG
ncbi:MAG: CRTAC1 family protein, partial [Acidobacteriota bacterium]